MNNLTTRKIVLGMLMTLVLGLGVQGVVDAVTTNLGAESTSPVDITARQVGSDMPARTIGSISIEDSDTDQGPDNSNTNETITVSTSNIQLTSPTFTTSTVTFYELPADRTETATSRLLDGTDIELQGYFIREGKATLTIRYTELSENQGGDSGDTSSKSLTHTYTYYVVKADANIPETTTFSLAGASSKGYQTGLNGRTDFSLYSNSTGNYPVTFSVLDGAGSAITNGLYTGKDPANQESLGANPISSSSGRKVWLNMNGADTFGPGATSVVTVRIGADGSSDAVARSSFNVVYIIGSPKLGISLTPDTDAEPDTVVNEELLRNRYRITNGTAGMGAGMITATVHDGTATVDTSDGSITGGTIAGALVKFELRHKGSTAGYLQMTTGTRIDEKNNTKPAESFQSIAQTLYVRTGTGGTAAVTYAFGTLRNQEITVSSVGLSKMVTAEIGAGQTDQQISVKTNRRQSGDPKKYDLVAEVEDGDGEPISDKIVTFSTVRGTLAPVSTVPTGVTNTAEVVMVETNAFGEAHVVYDIGSNTGRQEILASFTDGNDRESVTFVIGGSGQPSQSGQQGTQQQRLDISVFGDDGDTSRAVIVNALNSAGQAVSISIPITLSGTALVTSQSVNTGAVTTITPPTDPDTYTIIATDPAGNYASDTETITVGGPAGEGTLDVTTVGDPVNNQQTIEVTLEDADGDAPTGEVVVTLTGPGISRTVDTRNGTGRAIITLPTTATYTLTLSADGYATREVTLSVSGVVQDDPQTRDTTTTLGGVARSVRIASDPFPSGPANRQLAQPLRVQVLDANNRGVASVRVTFEVVSGQGRLSQRGNGSAIRAQTDRNGNASANYTPLADGTSRVRATAAGVTQTVTFTITAGAGAPSPDDTTPSDTGVTPSREINPDVQVNASQRPPMLWVDGGSIYALVGADVERFAPSVDNALNIAVGGGKVYWTEMTGDSAGTINSAKLDGSDVKELKKIKAVPMGIAVDTETGDKLYWTNSRGRIQSADLDGSGIENVMLDLPGPMDIAVARGILYWTQYDATEGEGNVGIANATGRGTPKYISTGADAPGSIAIGGNKVYWTEMTGSNSGTINSANLNGSGAEELNDIRAVPMGIDVDSSRSKLYWTNSRGRVQSANLEGRKIENVVEGLGNPGDMVLSNSITAPAEPSTPSDSHRSMMSMGMAWWMARTKS